jgi:SH3 domain-containing YSC84-like protein 1
MVLRGSADHQEMKLTRLATFAILIAVPSFASDSGQRIAHAASAFRELMGTPDKGIPRDLLDRANCIVIIPGLKKGAFGFGGKYGRGFAACRGQAGWSAPASVRVEGASFGFQIGGSSTDVFMLVMNANGMKRLVSDKFTLGGEAAAAAGPVGRQTSANTDILMTAEILTWSRSRGIFAGLSLEGATIRPDDNENFRLYGKHVTNREIIAGNIGTPRSAQPFTAVLNQYANRRPVPKATKSISAQN